MTSTLSRGWLKRIIIGSRRVRKEKLNGRKRMIFCYLIIAYFEQIFAVFA